MDNSKFIIYDTSNILSALKKLDDQDGTDKVLFVQNSNSKIIGSLTDGDIRRSLIKGHLLDDSVSEIMHKKFYYISTNETNVVNKIRTLRSKDIHLIPLLDSNMHFIRLYNLNQQRSILPIDTVLMAGGKGERLRPLTDNIPKPLLPVGNKCIIDHNIDRIISYGVEHINVTCNYLKEQFYKHFEKPRFGVKINCITEPKFLGTIGSIKYIKRFYHDTILVMNSDLFTDLNYEDFYLDFIENNADMSIVAVPYTVSIPYGIMDFNGNHLINMIEKPTYNYYANAGIYLIKKSVIDLIPEDELFHATHLVQALLKKGGKIIRFPINGTWIDIGNPQEYQKAIELARHLK